MAAQIGLFIMNGLLKVVDFFYGLWNGLLWQSVKYVGIPLYIFGMVLAVAFSGGYFVLIIAGFILYFMYIKKILHIAPIDAPKTNG